MKYYSVDKSLVGIIPFLLLFFACGGGSNPPVSNEILIGEYGALTGTTAAFGTSVKNGIDMAFEDVNNSGGVLGKKLRVIVEDDQGKPEEAQTVAQRLINKDRVVAIIGESSSSRSLAAAPVCQSSRVPMISPAATNPRVTQVGDYIFRVCFIDTFQGVVMAQFAANDLKIKDIAILRDIRNEYSVGLADVFAEKFQSLGGRVVADESYSEGDNDFSAQLTLVKSKNPQAIFVPGYYTEAGLITRQARNLGIKVPLLGGDGWDSVRLLEIGGKALDGCYYSNHYSVEDPDPVIQKFVNRYKTRYGQLPDTNAALGYDAARILVDAIGRAGVPDSTKIRDALAQTRNFAGITGSITIDENRNAVKPAVILRVENSKLHFVKRVQP